MKRPQHTIALILACAVLTLATGCDNQTPVPMPSSTETAQKETSVPTETGTAKPTETKNENDIDTEARYQEARTSFANGETCATYQALADIGTYKDSTLLKEEIYLQNQLGFITLGAVDYFCINREAFALVPAHLIDEIFADKTWIVPNYQSHSYLDYELQADHTGEVYDPLLGQKTHDITWQVTENGFRIGQPDIITDQNEIHYSTEIRKAAEGVYIFYVPDAPAPLTGSDVVCYIDKESDFGKRYLKNNAIITSVIQNANTNWRVDCDPYGLYFIVQY